MRPSHQQCLGRVPLCRGRQGSVQPLLGTAWRTEEGQVGGYLLPGGETGVPASGRLPPAPCLYKLPPTRRRESWVGPTGRGSSRENGGQGEGQSS